MTAPALPGPALYPRREFYTRFLILSSGPDGQPGVPYLTDTRLGMFNDSQLKNATSSNLTNIVQLLMLESQAAQATFVRSSDIFQTPQTSASNPDFYTDQLQVDGLDDVTNHNLMSSGVPVQ